MDSKQHPDPKYLISLYDFFSNKYALNTFDLVITTDDAAFNFIRTYSNLISEDTPIFFCGVNNKVDSTLIDTNRITGIIETNDYKSTIEVMRDLHPERNKIIVINDNTVTGRANKKNLDSLIPYFEKDLEFEYWSDLNMNELLAKCENTPENASILLLSFNQDKSFNDFSYDESIKLISEHTNAPIYGLWDFYLGKGIVGGSVQSGYNQGSTLGKMVTSYLDGTSINEMPIKDSGLDEFQFDYEQLSKFDISKRDLPQGSKVINNPYSIIDFIQNNIFLVAIIFLILLLIIIILLSLSIYLSKKVLKQEQVHSRTDKLTGIYNRRACFEILEEQIEYCKDSNSELTICFADVNRLKYVNDNFGHEYGDTLIKNMCNIFKNNIHSNDYICRIGGDEFVFIFIDTSIVQAKEILNRINKQLDIINDSKKYPFTMSFSYGLSFYDKYTCNNASDLIKRADKLMYEHKMRQRKEDKK